MMAFSLRLDVKPGLVVRAKLDLLRCATILWWVDITDHCRQIWGKWRVWCGCIEHDVYMPVCYTYEYLGSLCRYPEEITSVNALVEAHCDVVVSTLWRNLDE